MKIYYVRILPCRVAINNILCQLSDVYVLDEHSVIITGVTASYLANWQTS